MASAAPGDRSAAGPPRATAPRRAMRVASATRPPARKAANGSPVAYMVLRFPLVTETFVVRELSAVADQVAFPVELFALRPGRGGAVHPTANRWFATLQIASFARGCLELLRLAVTRPRIVARVIRDVLADYSRDPRALVKGLAVVILAASFVPAIRRRH